MKETDKYYCSNCGYCVCEKDSYCKRCGHKITIYNMKDIDDYSFICESCRIIVPLGKRFCPKCGTKMEWKNYLDLKCNEHICQECGYIYAKEDNYCSRCGIKFDLNYIFSENKEKHKDIVPAYENGEISGEHSFIERARKAINSLRPLKNDKPNNIFDNRWKNANPKKIEKAKELIETLFKELNFYYATDSKVLGRLLTFDENLVKELDLNISNIKEFVEKNYNDYYCENSFIGKKEIVSPKKMVVEYFKCKKKINHQMILDFFNSIGYSNHKSYKIYFDELVSNNFFRIDDEIVITYDSFEMDESIIKEIKSSLDYYFENSTIMNTAKLSRYYFMLPRIQYSWNSYVLALVIKKYLSEEYAVTENFDGKNYMIRRKQNESI